MGDQLPGRRTRMRRVEYTLDDAEADQLERLAMLEDMTLSAVSRKAIRLMAEEHGVRARSRQEQSQET